MGVEATVHTKEEDIQPNVELPSLDATEAKEKEVEKSEEKADCNISRKAVLATGFAFTAGWVDVVTFHAFDSFGVLMTGNMVKLAISIFDDKKNGTDAGFYISIMMSYMLGCTLFQIIKRYFPSYPAWACCPVCLTLLVLSDTLHDPTDDSNWRVLLIAPAFALQNSLTFGGPMAVHTTIITGNYQKVGIFLYKVLFEPSACLKELKAVIKPIMAIAATFAGATAGAAWLMKLLDDDSKYSILPIAGLQCFFLLLHDFWFRKKDDKA